MHLIKLILASGVVIIIKKKQEKYLVYPKNINTKRIELNEIYKLCTSFERVILLRVKGSN